MDKFDCGSGEYVPKFEPQIKRGRWFVLVATGNGPDSHIGDFGTKSEAEEWILSKSKYWPSKPSAPKVIPKRPMDPQPAK